MVTELRPNKQFILDFRKELTRERMAELKRSW
jgi:hypothetical protein